MNPRFRLFTEDQLLPLSALQHLVFCERQCALIHIEQQWQENPLTLEGSHLHARVDKTAPLRERRADLTICRRVALRTLRLGLSGLADVVEFHRRTPGELQTGTEELAQAVPIPGLPGVWQPFPVDYKRGKPKKDLCDEVQLCAQALCLEEMLEVSVPEGALFYGRLQRRWGVVFDKELRFITEKAARRLHELLASNTTPRARRMPKCRRCSLLDICMPETGKGPRSGLRYLDRIVAAAQQEDPES